MNIDGVHALARIWKGKRAKDIPISTFDLPFALAKHSECGCHAPRVIGTYLQYPRKERAKKVTDPVTRRKKPLISPPKNFRVNVVGKELIHAGCGKGLLASNIDQAHCHWLSLSPTEQEAESQVLGDEDYLDIAEQAMKYLANLSPEERRVVEELRRNTTNGIGLGGP